MDVLIDRRELLEEARERNVSLQMVEKDYVLGWLLVGFSKFDSLVFKGGTALSKIYFPKTWRLSEDLDFAFTGKDFSLLLNDVSKTLLELQKQSGTLFEVRNQFTNPDYLQLKIRYKALLSINWAKVDATREGAMDEIQERKPKTTYSDYPDFTVRVESLEEIFAEKLRSLMERKKCRDYYDVWRLCSTEFAREKLLSLFLKKCALKEINFKGIESLFAGETKSILEPYWERELGRLLNPLPDLADMLIDMKRKLSFLEGWFFSRKSNLLSAWLISALLALISPI